MGRSEGVRRTVALVTPTRPSVAPSALVAQPRLEPTVSQAAALPLAGKRVIITENKMNFLTLPPLTDTVALWGQGFQVHALRTVTWLHHCAIHYWGDLDVQGFQILAQVCTLFPQTQARLMDRATFDAFAEFAVPGTPTLHAPPAQLTPAERELYEHLAANGLRLEQERIHQAYVLQHLP